MTKIPKEIAAAHVHEAIVAFDPDRLHGFQESRDYDLLYEGHRYPPKAIVGIAAEIATEVQY